MPTRSRVRVPSTASPVEHERPRPRGGLRRSRRRRPHNTVDRDERELRRTRGAGAKGDSACQRRRRDAPAWGDVRARADVHAARAGLLHALTAPRPGGLYTLRTQLSNGAIVGLEKLTSLEAAVGDGNVAGVNGDFFASDAIRRCRDAGGIARPAPFATRSSIGLDVSGLLDLDRLAYVGNWHGTGQRRRSPSMRRREQRGDALHALLRPDHAAAATPTSSSCSTRSAPRRTPTSSRPSPAR